MHLQIFNKLQEIGNFKPTIFLVGMPAVGKTSKGKRLAKVMDYAFYDLDEEIVKGEGKSVTQIFDEKGEYFFRLLETEYLCALLKPNCIIATGGGTPCFNLNMEWMNEFGTTIWLDAPLNYLVARAIQSNKRPMFRGMDKQQIYSKMETVLSERKPFYNMAQHRFEVKFC